MLAVADAASAASQSSTGMRPQRQSRAMALRQTLYVRLGRRCRRYRACPQASAVLASRCGLVLLLLLLLLLLLHVLVMLLPLPINFAELTSSVGRLSHCYAAGARCVLWSEALSVGDSGGGGMYFYSSSSCCTCAAPGTVLC